MKEFAPRKSEIISVRIATSEKGGKYFHVRLISLGGVSIPL